MEIYGLEPTVMAQHTTTETAFTISPTHKDLMASKLQASHKMPRKTYGSLPTEALSNTTGPAIRKAKSSLPITPISDISEANAFGVSSQIVKILFGQVQQPASFDLTVETGPPSNSPSQKTPLANSSPKQPLGP